MLMFSGALNRSTASSALILTNLQDKILQKKPCLSLETLTQPFGGILGAHASIHTSVPASLLKISEYLDKCQQNKHAIVDITEKNSFKEWTMYLY